MGRGFEGRSSRGRRSDDSSEATSDDASTSGSEGDEWVLEGASDSDVESGGWCARREGRDGARGRLPPRRGASRGELEPILKPSRFAAYGDADRPAPPARFDEEADAFLARRSARSRTSILAAIAALAVLAVACVTLATTTTRASDEFARSDDERATLSGHARAVDPAKALRHHQHHQHPLHIARHHARQHRQSRPHASSRIRSDATELAVEEVFGEFAPYRADTVHRDETPLDAFRASSRHRQATTLKELAAAAAKAGLIIPEMGTFPDDASTNGDSAVDAASRLANVRLDFAALGDSNADVDSNVDSNADSNAAPRRRYLVGLTTSAGFGDQFKRVSTYASMARDLDRALVLWPVFTSPHYALDGEGEGPLFFEDYVRITGEGATDAEGRVVSYRDAPARVRDFPRLHPGACAMSNDNPNPVQFLTSRNLSNAVVAPAGKRQSYEALVRAMRDDADEETVCVAATFSARDYDTPSHGEDAAAWRALDFRPKGKFEHYWANAVDSLRAEAARGKERREMGMMGRGEGEGDATPRNVPRNPRNVPRNNPTPPTPPTFRVTPAYTALHWRRGDKCGRKSKRQRARRDARVRFDGNATGSGAALMCDDYEKARVLDLCEAMPPVYVATDDDDPAFVAHLKSRGCFLSSDLKLGAPRHTLTDVDLLMVDVMLVSGAEVSLTFGHTALARLYDRMRMARGTPRSINVAADAGAFKRAYERALAGAGASAAAAASLGDAKDTLFVEGTGIDEETKAEERRTKTRGSNRRAASA